MAEAIRRKREKESLRQSKNLKCSRKADDRGGACNGIDDIEDFSVDDVSKIRITMLGWYYEHQRILPWRINQCEEEERGEEERESRAYAVWVSEVMLQQTQVATVIDYYKRWMAKWPTIQHLAEASQEEVNEMWGGLGYYRRARFLLEGAKSIAQVGEFPKTASDLQNIRGIGNYTAGAIASIAYGEAVPLVDGNVIRVIARIKAISATPKGSKTLQKFWKLAAQLVDPAKPGDFNQSLMELGATLCTPLNPSCSLCPISDHCKAALISKQDSSVKVTDFPAKVIRPKQRHEFTAICVLEIAEEVDLEMWKARKHDNSVFLLMKRPESGLLAGLWEFPSVLLPEEVGLSSRRKAIDEYLDRCINLNVKKTGRIILRKYLGKHVHGFSHIRLLMHVELLVLHLKGEPGILSSKQGGVTCMWKWANDKTIRGMGLTSGVRKVYDMVLKYRNERK